MRFWMNWAGQGPYGRIARRLATWFAPPYLERHFLASLNPKGYISPSTNIHHPYLRLGANVFIGDRVVIFQDYQGGPVELEDHVRLYYEILIHTGAGGSIRIGKDTHVQPRCHFFAYKASIQIGSNVDIAPTCAFYPYDHGFEPGEPIRAQPLQSKGDIIIEDGAWLGYGVIVLSGVHIGKGAVIGAGSVVTKNIPAGGVAFGVPARLVKMRGESALDDTR
jgi:acetyltransferase-like isoleucine patch superfamily enzyme